MLTQAPAFNFLPSGIQDALIVCLLFGWSVEAPVDGGVEGAAESFADALVVRGKLWPGWGNGREERGGGVSAYVDPDGCGFEVLECAGWLGLLLGWQLALSLRRRRSTWVGEIVSALALRTRWVSVVVWLSLIVVAAAC